jgi:hypothetical protein
MSSTKTPLTISEIRRLDANEIDSVAGGFVQEMVASLKLMNEILSNMSKARSEISMTFARNARA